MIQTALAPAVHVAILPESWRATENESSTGCDGCDTRHWNFDVCSLENCRLRWLQFPSGHRFLFCHCVEILVSDFG